MFWDDLIFIYDYMIELLPILGYNRVCFFHKLLKTIMMNLFIYHYMVKDGLELKSNR